MKNVSNKMTTYLTNLIEEKGASVNDEVSIEGHIGLTWQMLIDFIGNAEEHHHQIRTTLVKIDFHNGDVFHYLTYLAKGMLESVGYKVEEEEKKVRTYAVKICSPSGSSYEKLAGGTTMTEALGVAECFLLADQFVDSIRLCDKSDIGKFHAGCA